MRKIIPYQDLAEARLELDNGGRFYNILTKADDGIISESEIGKVAGVYNNKQKVILFLDLAISQLDSQKRYDVLNSMDKNLKAIPGCWYVRNFLEKHPEYQEIIMNR